MHASVRKVFLVLAVAVWTVASTPLFAQQDPILGMWKLNVAKSKYSPGPAPQSNVITFEKAGDAIKVTTKGVGADGKPTASEYTAKYDGKDYPIKGAASDTVSLRKVNERVVERTDKKGGKETIKLTRELAPDGKSFTVTVKGTNTKGEPVNSLLVWERM
jgi:hypothetical protein